LSAAILIGGVFEISSQSGPYQSAVNRSFASVADALQQTSEQDAQQYAALLTGASTLTRDEVQERLDVLVEDGQRDADQADSLLSTRASGDVESEISQELDDRLSAIRTLRDLVDRLLQLAPIPAYGVRGRSATAGLSTPSPSQATTDLDQIAAQFRKSNVLEQSARRTLLRAPGDARILQAPWPSSLASSLPGGQGTFVSILQSATSLAPHVDVILSPHSTSVLPGPVPTSTIAGQSTAIALATGTPASAALLPPTQEISVNVVVANTGNVDVQGVSVSVTIGPQSTPGSSSGPGVTQRVNVTAGTSTALSFPRLRITPGSVSTVAVSLNPPQGQSRSTNTQENFSLRVAPFAPPPTTTTSTTATTVPRRRPGPSTGHATGP
jgi:hypothetical protein